MSLLVQLFLGGSLAAVALLLGLMFWRLAQLPPSGKPAAERPKPVRTASPSPRQIFVEIAPRKEYTDLVQEIPAPVSEPDSKAPIVAPPPLPEPLSA
ncbi:MAG: hypothetical protein ACRELG_21230, partial [Gemmataceae bacterium]